MRITLLLILTCLLQAGDLTVNDLKIRTLPPEIYTNLTKGKALPLAWKAPGVDLSKGWSLAGVEYRAEELNSGLLEALKAQASGLAGPSSPFKATFRVTENHRNKIWDTISFTIEGMIQDAAGNIVMAFVGNGGYTESIRNPGRNAVPAMDEFISKLIKELK